MERKKHSGNERRKKRYQWKKRPGVSTSRDPLESAQDHSAILIGILECEADGSLQAGSDVLPADFSGAEGGEVISAGNDILTRVQAEGPRATQQTATIDFTACNEDVSLDKLNGNTIESGIGIANGNYDTLDVERKGVRWPIVEAASEQGVILETEHAVVPAGMQLQDLTEALTLEQETTALLRDQVHGQIVERRAVEADMRSQINRLQAEKIRLDEELVGTQQQIKQLTSENARLQKQVDETGVTEQQILAMERMKGENFDLRVLMNTEMEKMTAKINRLTAENGALRSTVDDSQAELRRLAATCADNQSLVGTREDVKVLALDVERLSTENQDLRSLVVQRENEIKRLQEDYQQAKEKALGSERELQQVFRKGTANGQTNRWDGWSVQDPSAIAAAVAEELRLQKLAISQTVEKLLGENDHLIRKVNEQAALILALTRPVQNYSVDNYQSLLPVDGHDLRSSFVNVSSNDAEPVSESQDGSLVDNVSYDYQQDSKYAPAAVDMRPENLANFAIQTSEQQLPIDLEISRSKRNSEPTKPVTNVQPVQGSHSLSAGSASLIIKAPFRLISAIAGYISGRDLAKN